MKIKTAELTGAALDWAVATCEHAVKRPNYGEPCFNAKSKRIYETEGLRQIGVNFEPSTNWTQGGSIIERERLSLQYSGYKGRPYYATHPNAGRKAQRDGPTPLIAAMRCYVASKLGDEVDIPKELTR